MVGLLDASKLGRSAMVSMLQADALDAVVVDEGADAELVAAYRTAGLAVHVA